MSNQNQDIVQQAVQTLNSTAVPHGPSDELFRQTLEAIADECPKSKPNFILERIRNMKPIGKVAAAAIIIMGVSAALLFNTTPGSIALADVYAKVQQAHSFMYKMSMTMNGQLLKGMPPGRTEMEGTITISSQYGMKMNITTHVIEQDMTMQQQMYILPQQKKILSVTPTEKMYQTIEFSDDFYERVKQQNCDPRETIKQMLACKYTDLGRSEIDGVTVQGYETSDPAYSGGIFSNNGGSGSVALWIDVNTWLPVRSEMTFNLGENAEFSGVITDFHWNIPLQASDFEPVIPDDYKSMGKMKMPEMTEESMIEGLRFYADTFGYYPKKLDLMELIQEASRQIASNRDFMERIVKKQANDERTEDELMSELMQGFMAPIQSMGMYYMTLVQDQKDPAYFGQVTTPGDEHAVLMRWKLEGDTYRVVFGDLTIADMSHADLIEIEPEITAETDNNTLPETVAVVSAGLKNEQLKMNYESMKNVKQMVMACWQYSQKHNGQWPDTLEALLDEGLSPDVFKNPRQPNNPNSYVYLKPTDPANCPSPAKTVVIYESFDTWNIGTNVGFMDGHVEFIQDQQQFENLLPQ